LKPFLSSLAAGRSVKDLVQMAGRSTFNDLNVLHRNMGSHAKVKILIQYRDWDLAIAYYRFQHHLFDLAYSPTKKVEINLRPPQVGKRRVGKNAKRPLATPKKK